MPQQMKKQVSSATQNGHWQTGLAAMLRFSEDVPCVPYKKLCELCWLTFVSGQALDHKLCWKYSIEESFAPFEADIHTANSLT